VGTKKEKIELSREVAGVGREERNLSKRKQIGAGRRQGGGRTVGEKSVIIAVFAISSHPVIRVRYTVHCVSGFLPENVLRLSHRDCRGNRGRAIRSTDP